MARRVYPHFENAETTVPTAVVDGADTQAWYDQYGRAIVAGGAIVTVLDLIPTVYAAGAIANNQVLATGQALAGVSRVVGGTIRLDNLIVKSYDDHPSALTVYFFDTAAAVLGVLGAGITITDAHLASLVGKVKVLASDYDDMINSRVAQISNINLTMKCPAAGTGLWVAICFRDAAGVTYTATGLALKMSFIQDL